MKRFPLKQFFNFCHDDPLLDYLNRYGKKLGFAKDNEFSKYNKNLSFDYFLEEKTAQFKSLIIEKIKANPKIQNIFTNPVDLKNCMLQQPHVICNAKLENNTITAHADLLIRSDIFHEIFNEEPFSFSTRYILINIHYCSIKINTEKNKVLTSNKTMYYNKFYNHMSMEILNEIQDLPVHFSYLMGRKYTCNKGLITSNCFKKLGKVEKEDDFTSTFESGLSWLRLLELPNALEIGKGNLFPNMCNSEDAPWHHAKKQIAASLKEITSVWNCGVNNRSMASLKNIHNWQDPECCSSSLGHKMSGKTSIIIDNILNVNRSNSAYTLQKKLTLDLNDLIFYIDFETVNNLIDDFKTFPNCYIGNVIFNIGCGWSFKNGPFVFKSFFIDNACLKEEKNMLISFFTHIASIVKMHNANTYSLYHWHNAEINFMNDAFMRHPELYQKDFVPNCVDLKKIFMDHTLVINGSLNYKLKSICRALYNLNFINSKWGNSFADGLAAMICYIRYSTKPEEYTSLIQEIKEYNRLDCLVMYEILGWLKKIE